MGLLSRITGLFAFSRSSFSANDSAATVVVDLDTLGHFGVNGRQPSVQDKRATLNRMIGFVEREKLPLVAVLRGQPLRDVPDGDEIRGVTVRYVERQADAAGFIASLLRQTRHRENAVVVTTDRQVEKAAHAVGCQAMHSATFKKVLEQTEAPRQRQSSRPAPERQPVDENRRIVNELIDPL